MEFEETLEVKGKTIIFLPAYKVLINDEGF